MIEGATITLPLSEFDRLRTDSEDFQRLIRQIAVCFEYEFKEYAVPEKCKTCKKENPDCTKCKVFKESPPWEEILTVDTKSLINFAKQYALYGKETENFLSVKEMTVVAKEKRGESK